MQPKGTTFTCEQCGVAFVPQPKAKGRFCSRACWRAHEHAQQPVATCVQCGIVFHRKTAEVKRRATLYCSRSCFQAARRPVRPIEERFWAKVDKRARCWLWMGARDANGYGRMGRGRRRPKGGGEGTELVHRLSWEFHYGPIADGLFVCHRCDQPCCVRPDHLFLGTQKDNMQDMMRKLRARNQFSASGPPAVALRWYGGQTWTTCPSAMLRPGGPQGTLR